jgi:alkylated DNA repair dioxygenase AlkB
MSLLKRIRQEREKSRTALQKESVDEEQAPAVEASLSSLIVRCALLEPDFKFPLMVTSLEPFQLTSDYPVFFIPEAITATYEQYLLSCVMEQSSSWVYLRTRRLQCWGTNETGLSAILPKWLDPCTAFISRLLDLPGGAPVNHCLINHYEPGQGVPHHTDGPKYVNKVAILSLGSPVLMTFRRRLSTNEIGIEYAGDIFSVMLEPRSILVFEKEVYDNYMHGIDSRYSDRVPCDGSCLNIDLGADKEVNNCVFYSLSNLFFDLIALVYFEGCEI